MDPQSSSGVIQASRSPEIANWFEIDVIYTLDKPVDPLQMGVHQRFSHSQGFRSRSLDYAGQNAWSRFMFLCFFKRIQVPIYFSRSGKSFNSCQLN